MKKNKNNLSKNIQKIKQKLQKQNKTITFAESCTGGLIAREFAKIDGISNIFNGSIVSYSDDIKIKYLRVKPKTIKKYGVVSLQVTKQMAIGAISLFNSNISVSVSGIAGSGGGSKKKPVGTVSICVININKNKYTSKPKIINKIYHFKGNRKSVQLKSAKKAIKNILKIL
jgi:nicotinamide-nucleotide amidase